MVCFEHAKKGRGRSQPAVALYIIPFTASILLSGYAQAASINTEASSTQRTATTIARSAAPLRRSQVTVALPAPAKVAVKALDANRQEATRNEIGDGVPDLSWGGPRAPRQIASVSREPMRTPAAVRQVSIPVLGREGPAAARANSQNNAPFASQPISIPASQPALTSAVRSQDVADFQKIGAPYQVTGTWYVPAHEPDYDETGVASWYGSDFHGRSTANGELFDMNVVSAAHPTLPIPSLVEVTNLTNGRSMIVRINDRGPFVRDRLIDLSARGAELLGFKGQGHTNVRVRYVGPATAEPVVTAQNISAAPSSVALRTAPPTAQAQAQVRSQAQTGQTFVQVGAFSQRVNAERLRSQSLSLGRMRVIETAQPDGKSLYRVVLPVANRSEADAKAAEISNNGYQGARVLASLN